MEYQASIRRYVQSTTAKREYFVAREIYPSLFCGYEEKERDRERHQNYSIFFLRENPIQPVYGESHTCDTKSVGIVRDHLSLGRH